MAKLHTITETLETVKEGMRALSHAQATLEWPRWLPYIRDLLHLPEVIMAFGVGTLLFGASLLTVCVLHLAIKWIQKGTTTVFVSYQHDRLPEANRFSKTMLESGVHII